MIVYIVLSFFSSYNIIMSGRGGFRISGNGIQMYNGMGFRYADFISFFLNII